MEEKSSELIELDEPWLNTKHTKEGENKTAQKPDFPRTVAVLDNSNLVFTDHGAIFEWCSETRQWSLIYNSESLRKYAVADSDGESSSILAGTLTGAVVLLKRGTEGSLRWGSMATKVIYQEIT